MGEPHGNDDQISPTSHSTRLDKTSWDSDTSATALRCLVDLLDSFFDVVRLQLPGVVSIMADIIQSPMQGPASTGVAAFMQLAEKLGGRLSDEEWKVVFTALKDAAASSLPSYMKLLKTMEDIDIPDDSSADMESSDRDNNDEIEDDSLQTASYVTSRTKSHISVQLLILQVYSSLS